MTIPTTSRAEIPAGSYDDAVRNVQRNLWEFRAARRLSLQVVADRAGISKAHVWDLERGAADNPTLKTAFGIARALGVSLDQLCGLTTSQVGLHPEALRIACEIDALLAAAIRKGEV